MGTFNSTYGSTSMAMSVSSLLDSIERKDEAMDIHTVTLVLNGQHGEFDLTVVATDDDMEEHQWEGVAHRSGGVSGFKEVAI